MIKLIIFVVVSAGIIILSKPYLSDPRSHGFYRFFAFESILILYLLNMSKWFYDPFSIFQIISWVLLFLSLFFVLYGVYTLRSIGKPKDAIEDTTVLVIQGIYKYIRHPMYTSVLLLGWGIFFKDPTLLGGILVLATSAFTTTTAKVEESENIKKFDKTYLEYMKKTKMFIPFII